MAGPIYKVFRASFSEAWYQLSKEQQASVLTKVNEARVQSGCTSSILYDSSWSSEEWQLFGIEVYPNLEAVQKHYELLKAFDWFRYLRSSTLLGTEMAD